MSQRIDLRYLAGIVDGEGCISLHANHVNPHLNKHPRVVLHFSVSNTCRSLILDIKEQFGGSVYTRLPKKQDFKALPKYCYCWCLGERATVQLLKRLLPFLRVKQRQAKLAIEFQKIKDKYTSSRSGRPLGAPLSEGEYKQRLSLVRQCKLLNRVGGKG